MIQEKNISRSFCEPSTSALFQRLSQEIAPSHTLPERRGREWQKCHCCFPCLSSMRFCYPFSFVTPAFHQCLCFFRIKSTTDEKRFISYRERQMHVGYCCWFNLESVCRLKSSDDFFVLEWKSRFVLSNNFHTNCQTHTSSYQKCYESHTYCRFKNSRDTRTAYSFLKTDGLRFSTGTCFQAFEEMSLKSQVMMMRFSIGVFSDKFLLWKINGNKC